MGNQLSMLCKRIRYSIVSATTEANSGHPSSSLSAVELLSVLFFGEFFKQDISNFQNPLNDKFIMSKGHAAPLLYALYEAAGVLTHEEMLTLRKFSSHLQGHPTPELPFVDVATGSLGQGLSIGVGMAMGLKQKTTHQLLTTNNQVLLPRVFVLLGDSEFAEGQNYEALQIASSYKLNNLIGILDVNRLGQRGETQLGWDTETYKKRVESFGWNTVVINDGHNIDEIQNGFHQLLTTHDQRPKMIIAKTIKGKGFSIWENKNGWHSKPLSKDQLFVAIQELGEIDKTVKGEIGGPELTSLIQAAISVKKPSYPSFAHEELISTKEVFGKTLVELGKQNENVVVIDGDVSNSTNTDLFAKAFPNRFYEMYIAEQNMVSAGLGFSVLGIVPFVTTFGAFFTRAFDQIRMAQYTLGEKVNPQENKLILASSYVGVSNSMDGASGMALEDIAMMRSIRESTVLYPSDAVSTAKLTSAVLNQPGISYLRLTREKLPILYDEKEEFPIGSLKLHYCHSRERGDDTKYDAVIIAAGITLHEALKAQKILEEKHIHTVVVDLYSVKPLDSKTLLTLVQKTKKIIVVEDHYEAGGIGEAVLSSLITNDQLPTTNYSVTHLCVRKEPRSGTPEELLHYEAIDAEAIVAALS